MPDPGTPPAARRQGRHGITGPCRPQEVSPVPWDDHEAVRLLGVAGDLRDGQVATPRTRGRPYLVHALEPPGTR
jgi:hypothetical protein